MEPWLSTRGYEDKQRAISGPIYPQALDAASIVAAAKEGWRIEPRQERVFVALSKIKTGSDAAKHYKDDDLLKNFQEQIKSEKLRTPLRVTFDPNGEHPPFSVASGELGDLRLIAYQEYVRDNRLNPQIPIPCIVEYPGQYVITGPSQSLILSWARDDPENQLINTWLQDLPVPPPPETGRYELEIEPRSLMGTLYYLSHAIQVPREHEAAGLVTVTMTDYGEVFDWGRLTGNLLRVSCSPRRPACAAVTVPYRGHWFYIDDRDRDSKTTFTLLMQLFELQAGGGAQGTKPVLTLPVRL